MAYRIEIKDKAGMLKRVRREWRQIAQRPDHYLDAEIYGCALYDNLRLTKIIVNAEGNRLNAPPARRMRAAIDALMPSGDSSIG